MNFALSLTVAAILCLNIKHRSFVDGAALGSAQGQPPASGIGNTQAQDASVRELESLKHTLGKTLAMMKANSATFSEVNGHREAHVDTREEVDVDGKLVARLGQHVDGESTDGTKPSTRVRTEVEVPSRGIHKTNVVENKGDGSSTDVTAATANGNRRSLIVEPGNQEELTGSNGVDKYGPYSGAQYSPLDMAEYVFWTGDEKGVTMAIEEFLQEGLMTREEAIAFLQEIKYNLDYLQSHYSQQLGAKDKSKSLEGQKNILLNAVRTATMQKDRQSVPPYDISDLRQDMNKKSEVSGPSTLDNTLALRVENEKRDQVLQDEDYEELLEKLRVADFLYTEYSLEEVIYQLAKVMFAQSLTRGSVEAQEALKKFTNFLETEAEQGHISRSLEKKVLDVLIAALTDTLTEHPELIAAAREGLGGGIPTLPESSHVLRQILESGTADKTAAHKDNHHQQGGNNNIRQQNKESILYGKYKAQQ